MAAVVAGPAGVVAVGGGRRSSPGPPASRVSSGSFSRPYVQACTQSFASRDQKRDPSASQSEGEYEPDTARALMSSKRSRYALADVPKNEVHAATRSPGSGLAGGDAGSVGFGALELSRTAPRRKSVHHGHTRSANRSQMSAVNPTIFSAWTRQARSPFSSRMLFTVMNPRSMSSWPSGLKVSSNVMPAARSPSCQWSQWSSASMRLKSWTSSWNSPCQ